MATGAKWSEISLHAREMTHDAINRLKDSFPKAISAQDLISFLVPKQADPGLVDFFFKTFKRSSVVSWKEKENTYRFKPPYDISSAEELLKYFQQQDIAKGIPIPELQQGWKDCVSVVNDLDDQHKIIVLRHKKDRSPRMIWGNDPTLYAPLDEVFIQKWKAIALPGENEIRDKLKAMSSRAAGDAPKPVFVDKVKAKKKVRRGHKVTNVSEPRTDMGPAPDKHKCAVC